MSFRRLSRLEIGTQVSAATARNDRIDLVYGEWFVSTRADDDLANFFRQLADPSLGTPGNFIWFRSASRNWNFSYPTLVIVKGPRGDEHPRPLFTGKLKTRRRDDPSGNFGTRRRLTLDLTLNVTRYVHNQLRVIGWRDHARQGRVEGEVTLLSRRPYLDDDDERSLDGNDNVLLGRHLFIAGDERLWSLHTRRYWSAVQDLFNRLFRSSAENNQIDIARTQTLNLREVETYWEFQMPDPLDWMGRHEASIRQFGRLARVHHYDAIAECGQEGNSRSIKITVRSGVSIRVYAKTTRRLRFEVEHDLLQDCQPISNHTTANPDDLYQWLGLLNVDAALHVNRLLRHLDTRTLRTSNQRSRTQLIVEITRLANDDEIGDSILAMLTTNQSVICEGDHALTLVVRKLVRAGILRTVTRNARRYVLTEAYQSAGLDLAIRQQDEPSPQ